MLIFAILSIWLAFSLFYCGWLNNNGFFFVYFGGSGFSVFSYFYSLISGSKGFLTYFGFSSSSEKSSFRFGLFFFRLTSKLTYGALLVSAFGSSSTLVSEGLETGWA